MLSFAEAVPSQLGSRAACNRLLQTIQEVELLRYQKNRYYLHILQLFGLGGVHSTDSHLKKILNLIPKDVETFLHLFTDGRDSDPHAALEVMKDFEMFLQKYPHVVIASMS